MQSFVTDVAYIDQIGVYRFARRERENKKKYFLDMYNRTCTNKSPKGDAITANSKKSKDSVSTQKSSSPKKKVHKC